MSWLVVTDRKILKSLHNQKVIAGRTVILGGQIDLAAFCRGDYEQIGERAAHRLRMRIYDVSRCVVSIVDEVTSRPVGVYVWDGPEKIQSSKDPKITELANLLAEEFGAADGVRY